ncbi:hypothetical protein OB2597_10946 [Pseudooceanicola batsensis HTCC2597]|uniref:NlpC/P60 domain-containing protein n=1 Tax=Pseudooceanicola batsensis (strain ATCC BAA-863 / DSM 15984 / KCTC 12145 / HTCC2597) TaxID=252305 RepID=A3TVV9_PSEBH|nr:NlpC/P60 family protein [Pseudooceanicola batsensis]EAQ03755.1 hypothetical protein OB2597_10946 [Pseudooceanicola batsensis HTCC2597]
MNDRRVLKSNGRVADVSLRGQTVAERYVTPDLYHVSAPVAPILDRPEGGRDRELAFGEGFHVLEFRKGWAFGHAQRDGYVGYIAQDLLSDRMEPPTHRVISPSYRFDRPALKCAAAPGYLPIGARVAVAGVHRDHCDWGEISLPEGTGFVPMPTLAALSETATDPVAEAERYLGVPYLWGGNSGFGTDCSGLVQAAFLACGYDCPGDSDQQAAGLGTALDRDAPARRNDLIFWKGHVALVAGDGRILHANAHHMAVAYEDMEAAIARIAASDGPVTGRRRVLRR